jgi:hypothetical protein
MGVVGVMSVVGVMGVMGGRQYFVYMIVISLIDGRN